MTQMLSLNIHSYNFGVISPDDLSQLIFSAINLMDKYYGKPTTGFIDIDNCSTMTYPNIYYDSVRDIFFINLSTKDHLFSQYYYQFFHEHCHLKTNSYNIVGNYGWFEESICELASFFGMRKMAQHWKKNIVIKDSLPNYGYSIEKYISKAQNKPGNHLPKKIVFKDWFLNNLSRLENDKYLRDKNAIIANQLLPLFERHTELWRLMTYWNTWVLDDEDNIYMAFDKWLGVLINENDKILAQMLIDVFIVNK
ncbi:hypothetical protein G714_04289 [Escherichia coli HVH 39 (4-2679949)]|uniref:hypothetical protein n=1 Tax=Escherichia coli TaxID=562 RepID=UPI00038F9855|nr:hypothetical protein [Escherichia coli]EQO38509.1 hypothetical protein G714_04289 [Escherichia coli HVH 39 (4-2679949)]